MKDTPPLDSLSHFESYPEKNNLKEWVNLMDWQKSGDLSNTMYLLFCLKEITYGKDLYLKSKSLSQSQKQAVMTEKEQREAIQDNLLTKGGFYFLVYMFNKINKQVDFEADIRSTHTWPCSECSVTTLDQKKHAANH